MKKLTQAEFARLVDVNRSTVSRWIKNGRIATNADGLIDPEQAQRQRDATESPEPHHQARKAQFNEQRAAQPAKTDATPAQQSEEADAPSATGMEKLGTALKLETYKLQKARAEKAAMEVDLMAGSLVERAEVEFVLADFGQTLRGLLEGLPDRLAGLISAHQGDVTAIHRSIEESAGELLQQLSAHMERKMENIDEH